VPLDCAVLRSVVAELNDRYAPPHAEDVKRAGFPPFLSESEKDEL
jgi:hypothetical protein